MASIDKRVRRLELILASLMGGSAVLVVLVLGFFGYTTIHQIPHEVEQQIPGAVAKEIENKYPGIEKELKERMDQLANSEERAEEAAEHLVQFAATHSQRFASLETALRKKRFHDFGFIDCGETKKLRVPEGSTDEWVLFSVNPNMSAEEKRSTGDNALYSIATIITPLDDGMTWSVEFSGEVNYATSRDSAKKRTVVGCSWKQMKTRAKVQILAIRMV